jgi:phosphatidylinositol alpha-1,6-mannosyltransferase
MTAQHRSGVLGLFSGCVAPGGIQASGRIAWEAIGAASDALGPRSLLCYGDDGPADAAKSANMVHTRSRQRAVLAALATRRRFQLVVVWHMDMLKLVPLFQLRGARVVLILQGIEAWRRRRWPERALLKRVDLFLSISDYTWQRFLDANPEYANTPHQTVPLGIGTPFQGSPAQPNPAPAALMVSRLARRENYKGHREMLDAWPLVARQLPGAELWIAGDGDLRQDLEQLAMERGILPAVRFLGIVSDAHKLELIQQARCMALPSRGEGFGLVYLEAMRLGRPCLVSTVDAGREVVDPPRHGLAVDPDDRHSLAQALCRLLADGSEWQAWSIRARERYEQWFTAQHYQQRLLAALTGADSRHAQAS